MIILVAVYQGYKTFVGTAGETRYVLASVKKGTIITSVTGTGQVLASNQIDLKPKVPGDVVYIGANNGQEVKSGALVARLDARDAEKAVRDAQINLDSAKLALQKLQEPADTLSSIQAQNALTEALQARQKSESDLSKAYDDAFTAISNAFIGLPTVITGLQDILYKNSYGAGQSNIDYYNDIVKNYDATVSTYSTAAATTYLTARTAYDKNFLDYKAASRYTGRTTIDNLLDETYNTTKSIAEAVKSSDNFLAFVKDRLTLQNLNLPSQLATHQSNLATYTDKTNTNLLSLLNAQNAIKSTKDTLDSDDLAIQEKTESLHKLKVGADALDVASSQLNLKQRENALRDAQEKLSDYSLRAPFGGRIAKINIKSADSVSGADTVATLITEQKLAVISLNEIDVAKIKMGDKATLNFDAVDGLNISGEVAEIDIAGTVTQGVVTYSVKIGFDTQDDRIKPGMSVNAAIITNVKPDVLVASNSAIKSQGGLNYVEMLDQKLPQNSNSQNSQGIPSSIPPRQQPVEIGLSSDIETEIVSGLKEGDQIVVRTISTQTKTTPSAPTLFGASGGGRGTGGGGGAVRIPRD